MVSMKTQKLISVVLLLSFLTVALAVQPIIPNAEASTYKIDSYLSNMSVTKLSDGRYKVTYYTKATRGSTMEKIVIGYKWPTSYRLSGAGQEIDYNVGWHTMYLPAPAACPGWLTFGISYTAYTYSEYKPITTRLNQTFTTTTTYHTVTASEAIAMTVIASVAPNAFIEYKSLKYLAKISFFVGSTLAIADSINVSPIWNYKQGNYMKTQSTLSSTGTITTKLYIWNTYQDYTSGRTANCTASTYYNLPK